MSDQLREATVLVTVNVAGMNYTVPAGGEAERYFREMAAASVTEPDGLDYEASWYEKGYRAALHVTDTPKEETPDDD